MTNQIRLFAPPTVLGRPSEIPDPELNRIRMAFPRHWNSQYPVRVVPDFHFCCDVEPPVPEQLRRAITALGCSDVEEYENRFVRPASRWQKLAFDFVSGHFEPADHRVLIIETGRCQIFSGMERYILRKRSPEVVTVSQNSEHLTDATLVVHLFLETPQGLFKACIHRDSPDLLRHWS